MRPRARMAQCARLSSSASKPNAERAYRCCSARLKAAKASSVRTERACMAATEMTLRALRQCFCALLCATSAPGLSSGQAQIARIASSVEWSGRASLALLR